MKKHNETLYEEFQDIGTHSPEDREIFEKKLQDLKSFQGALMPSKEYKENLKSRLEAIYVVGAGQKGGWLAGSNFLGNIGSFASLVLVLPFMIYFGYILYDVNNSSLEDALQDTQTSEEILDKAGIRENLDQDMIINDVSNKDTFQDFSNISDGMSDVGGENIPSPTSSQELGETQIQVSPKMIRDIDQPVQDDIGGPTIEEQQSKEGSFLPPDEPPRQDENAGASMQSSSSPVTNDSSNDGISDDSYSQDNSEVENTQSPEPAQMMQSDMNDADASTNTNAELYNGGGFTDEERNICEEEYSGEIIEDGRVCRLKDGTTCERDELSTCTSRNAEEQLDEDSQ